MATLLAHIKVRLGSELPFERIAAELYRRTHADETGVRRYEYWRGTDPGTYYCLESFDELDGFLNHQTSEHHEAAGPALHDVIEHMRLEWVDPLADASPLTPTNPAPAPEDASDLYRQYHARYASILADWWVTLRALSAPPPVPVEETD